MTFPRSLTVLDVGAGVDAAADTGVAVESDAAADEESLFEQPAIVIAPTIAATGVIFHMADIRPVAFRSNLLVLMLHRRLFEFNARNSSADQRCIGRTAPRFSGL
jgi:hypothetical protein